MTTAEITRWIKVADAKIHAARNTRIIWIVGFEPEEDFHISIAVADTEERAQEIARTLRHKGFPHDTDIFICHPIN